LARILLDQVDGLDTQIRLASPSTNWSRQCLLRLVSAGDHQAPDTNASGGR
jgi:hypothetical protein